MSTKHEADVRDTGDVQPGKPWRKSIKLKTLLLVLLMVAPLVIMGIAGTLYYQGVIKQNVNDDALNQAKTIAAMTPEYMNTSQLYLKSIADRPLVVKALEENDRSFLHSMAVYADNTDRINGVFFTDSKGTILESTPGLAGLIGSNALDHAYVSSVIGTGDPMIGDAEPGGEQMPEVPIGLPVKDGNGTVIGVMVGNVDLGEFARTVVGTFVKPEQIFYMVNETGHVMIHKNPEYARTMTDFMAVPGVQHVLRGETGVGNYYNPIENQSRLGAYAPVEPMGWGVIVALPVDVAYQPVWNATWLAAGIIVLFSLVAIVSGLYLGNSITAPITNMSEATRTAFKSGDYRRLLPLKRDDEIGDLACSFDGMVDTVNRETAAREQATEVQRRQAEMIDLSPDAYIVRQLDGRIRFWSRGAESLYGWTADETAGRISHNLLKTRFPQPLEEILRQLQNTGRWSGELAHATKDGRQVVVQSRWLAQCRENGTVENIIESNVDITERKRADEEREMTVEFLRLVNDSKGLVDLIHSITAFVQVKSGCEAVGIRLRHGDDYPCYETCGFSQEFVLAETHLCLRDDAGLPVCDGDGYPILECMCGNVIRGRFDPSKPFFTARGSFWSNNTTKLLATTSGEDRQARNRNRCNGEGYESVAVIALRPGADCLGTLQMNDRRTGRFTPESIAMWERLADYLAVALSKFETEQALRESEEKYRELVENANSIIVRWSADGRIMFFNEFAEQFFGYDKDDVVGRDVSMLVPATDATGRDLVAMVEDIRCHPERYLANVNENVLKNGEHKWVMWTNKAVRDDRGNVVEILAIGNDITELRQAEEAREQLLGRLRAKTSELENANEELEVRGEELAAQKEELECANEELRSNNEELQILTRSLHETQDYLGNLINYANAPIIVWDTNFTITRFNRAFERLSGYTASDVLGKHLNILFPRDTCEESLDKIKKTLEGEQWESVEIPILHKFGSVRIALWNSANIYDDCDTLIATIAQGQDITRRKQAEKELEEARAQAELYLDLMGHDISNMHQIIMMQLELASEIMKLEGKLEGEDKDLIHSSARTLEKAAGLISNVQKLQMLRSGEYELETVDLAAMLKDVLKDYTDIPGRDIAIKYTPGSGNMVMANSLLKDVFGNLLDNAVKHSSGPLEIGVEVNKVGLNGSAYYRVTVEDNGNGIPDEKKDEVFQRFRRGQTKAKGTGLGLYLVKSLVEGFGGHVEVQNRILGDYTKGTRFLVYLPADGEGTNAGK